MLSEISEGRRFKPPSEIYRPGDLLPYTLRGITWKYALCFYDSDVYGTLLCMLFLFGNFACLDILERL